MELDQKDMDFESNFDINRISFDNVSNDFETKFKEYYRNSLKLMSDNRDRFMNANGANTLGILEKMALRIDEYNRDSNFEESFNNLLKEYEQFTDT